MKIPMKVDYGVRALVDLAERYGEGQSQTAEIAARQRIPEAYLDQVLTTLSKFGFIRSRRGPQGGHVLATPPEEITLAMVMNTLEGTVAPLDCLETPSECILSTHCTQRKVWRSVEEAIQSVLSSTTIAELVNHQRRSANQAVYQI